MSQGTRFSGICAGVPPSTGCQSIISGIGLLFAAAASLPLKFLLIPFNCVTDFGAVYAYFLIIIAERTCQNHKAPPRHDDPDPQIKAMTIKDLSGSI